MKVLKRCPAFVFVLIAMMIFTLLASGVASNWGNVKVKRINIAANEGTTVSALIYIPKTATDKNPAPVVMNFAGRSTNAQYLATWAMEQARRGFVAIACDVWGNGQSETIPIDNSSSTEFASTIIQKGIATSLEQAHSFINYARTCTFIDSSQMNIVGYSLGALNSAGIAGPYAEDMASICLVYMPGMGIAESTPDFPTNLLYVKSSGEESIPDNVAYEKALTEVFGLDEPVERNVLYGSYDDKTSMEYVYVPNTFHQIATINPATTSAIMNTLMNSNKNITYIEPENLVYPMHQVCMLICCVLFVMFIICLAYSLLKIPYFASIIRPVPSKTETNKKSLIFQYAWTILVPMLLFLPVGDLIMYYKPFKDNIIWRSNYLNGGFFPFVVFALLSLVLILILRSAGKKKLGVVTGLSDYGLTALGEGVPWATIGKAAILGAIVSINPSYLCRLYKKNTGDTLDESLRRIRLQKAVLLLSQSDIPIEDVGAMVGYRDPTNFIRRFKATHGKTPLQYRKEHCASNREKQ